MKSRIDTIYNWAKKQGYIAALGWTECVLNGANRDGLEGKKKANLKYIFGNRDCPIFMEEVYDILYRAGTKGHEIKVDFLNKHRRKVAF